MSDRRSETLAAHLRALEGWGIRVVDGGQATGPSSESDSMTAAPPPARSQPTRTDAPRAERAAKRDPQVESAPRTAARPNEPTLSRAERVARLEESSMAVANCERCRLHETRNKTVFGVGNPEAQLMFVGEAPGADEDRLGEPFVGRAGELLDRIIGAMGLERSDTYIANVLKCRPPGNRNPSPEEVEMCRDYLAEQIEIVAPRMIVALGLPASRFLLGTEDPLYKLRGRSHRYRRTPVVVTYHPAYLLRNPDAKGQTWKDLQAVVEFLELDPPSLRK